MQLRFNFFIFLFVWGTCLYSYAIKDSCPGSDILTTVPLPVDIPLLTSKIYGLANPSGYKVLFLNPEFENSIQNTFDTSKTFTKMEQFYTLLWVISQTLHKQGVESVEFSKESVVSVLMESKVFTDVTVPNRIQSISFSEIKNNESDIRVDFDSEGVEISLNQGRGFYLLRNGKCQNAKKLIFKKSFSFHVKKNKSQNLMVKNFEGVDISGDFGNRGIINVDIELVTLKSVEFYQGTPKGMVTAFVSREEFKKNKHSALLKLVTSMVPDRSVQPLDW